MEPGSRRDCRGPLASGRSRLNESAGAETDGAASGLAPRFSAWQVLQAVAKGAYADVALERELRRANLSARDRSMATALAYGCVRQRRRLDAWLDRCGRIPAQRQPAPLRWLLHVGLYQLLHAERIPVAAAVNTTVELAKVHGLARLAPVANAVLRNLLRRRQAGEDLQEPSDPVEALGLRHSLQTWLCRDLLCWLCREEADAFASHCNRTPGIDLRVNRLKTNLAQLRQALAAAGICATEIPMAVAGLQLPCGVGSLQVLPGYSEGAWCVQDRAAQLVAPLLDPQPGERVVDLCAAPGGKSTHLAELMGDRGEVLAIDRSAARLRRVRENAVRLGLVSIALRVGDATLLPDLHGSADRVLLDAPCSGLGTLARHADGRWRLREADIPGLVALQERLLEEAAQLVKPGGRLVYATCTVHPAENGEQVLRFLARHSHWRALALPRALAWLSGHATQLQLWPQRHDCDGFFAVALQKPLD